MKKINILKLFIVFIVFLFAGYIYLPKTNEIIEVNLGDIDDNDNINTTMNYPFEIKWEDEGFTNNRPSSITYNLYNVLDENTIVSTVTLTPSNVDSEDSNKWNGVFINVRKYNDDESVAVYKIESESINNYSRRYSSKYDSYYSVKSLCIEFGDNNFSGDSNKKINFVGQYYYAWDTPPHHTKYIRNSNNNSNDFYLEDINNKTICVPVSSFRHEFFIMGDTDNIDIKNIYPSRDNSNLSYSNYANIDDYDEFYGDDFESIKSDKSIKYIYNIAQTNKKNYPKADIIEETYTGINLKIDKYWDDEGYEDYRPSSIEIKLYNKEQPNIVLDTIVLDSSSSVDNYHWEGYFNNLSRFDNDGNIIQYIVRENSTNNYINYYDSKDGVVITFDERTYLPVDYAARILLKNPYDGEWYEYSNANTASGIGRTISNNKLVFDYNDNLHVKKVVSNDFPNIDYYKQNSSLKKVIELYGTNYPEMIHNMPIWEWDIWHYKTTPTSNAQEMYIYYNGASWGNTYGFKIDDIENIGNETIITSKINLKDITIKKIWNDEGYENNRVNSIKLSLYTDKELNNLYREETISIENEVDNNIWEKTIKKLPKYDKLGQEISYYVKEEKFNNYLTTYDKDESYDALSIVFSDDSVFNGYICFVDLGSTCTGYNISYFFEYNSSSSNGNAWASRTLNIPYKEFYILYDYNVNPEYLAKIISIEPTKIENYSTSNNYNFSYPYIYDHSYDDYFDSSDIHRGQSGTKSAWHYVWKGSITPLSDDVIITNEIDLTSFKVDKYWEDEGFEDNRDNVTISLYRDDDMNTPVSSKTINKNNQYLNDSTHWIAEFDNLPKYNNKRELIKYTAKEDNQEKYKKLYSKNEYNGMCIEFDDNATYGNYNSIKIIVKKNNQTYEMRAPGSYYSNINISRMEEKKVCLPVDPTSNDFYITNDTNNINIKKIYPVYMDRYSNTSNQVTEPTNCVEFEGDNYYNLPNNRCIHYTFKPTSKEFEGMDIITNVANMREEGYIKEFNDDGYEYNRPSEIVFGLFVDDDPVPKEMTTLHTSSCTNNRCNIEFKYVKDKDSDGNPINYTIKEISDYGYTVTYEDDKVINTANPVDVKFRKENIGHDILRGAKFEIYNKSGDKIIEFISKDTETTIKLIPSEYVVKEVEAPTGYSRSQDITFTVNENGTVVIDGKTENVVNIVNEPLKEKYDITIKKTLKTNETKDFTFEISITDFNGVLEYVGDRGGTITFNNNKATVNIGYNQTITIKDIPVNSVYEIKELGDDYLITIKGNNKGTLDRNENIEFINTPKEIPANGEEKEVPTPITGILNIASYIAGVLLLTGSIFLIVYSKKQINKKEI